MGYQWYRNGEPLLDATNTILTLQDVQFSDSGVYYAQVTNAFGSATTPSVRLTVVPGMEIRRVGAITNAQWAYTLDVVGHLAYVGIEGNGGGLKIYEVQNPAAPVLLGGLALDNSQQYVGVSDVVVSGERAYIAAGNRGLQILDVSNPAEPARIGQYCHHGERDGSDHSRADRLRGHFARRSNCGCEQPSRDRSGGLVRNPCVRLHPRSGRRHVIRGSYLRQRPYP